MIKYILFDFDGTLADTFEIFIKALNESAEKYGFRKVEPEEVESYRNMTAWAVVRKLRIPVKKMPKIAEEGRRMMHKEISHAKPFEGIEDMVKTLEQNYKLGIITSNSETSVKDFLSNNGLEGYFNDIYSNYPLLPKTIGIWRVLLHNRLWSNELAYVADEIRDVVEGRLARVPVISAAWGYNTKEALERKNPGMVISRPEEIYDV